MSNKRKKIVPKKPERVMFWYDESQKEALLKLARSKGHTLSSYMRYLADKELGLITE